MNTRFKVFASYNVLQYLYDFIHVLIFVTISKCRKSPKLMNIVITLEFHIPTLLISSHLWLVKLRIGIGRLAECWPARREFSRDEGCGLGRMAWDLGNWKFSTYLECSATLGQASIFENDLATLNATAIAAGGSERDAKH
jgi:hypothetical protein